MAPMRQGVTLDRHESHRQPYRRAAPDRWSSAAARIVSIVLEGYQGDIAVRLPDGRLAWGAKDADCTLLFRDPGALRELILHPRLSCLADCYLSGAIEVEGELERVFGLGTHFIGLDLSMATRLQLLRLALSLPARVARASQDSPPARAGISQNSARSIARHYDVGNEFYALWLDPEMVYSCAYFASPEQSLAAAQRDKLDYLCRKLRLVEGQRVLDIGCGWGALSLWAARHYGVRVQGITLSRAQQRLAVQRVEAAGLADRVRIDLLDYRDLPADVRYDRVVSVGMFEHVGVKNFPRYFATVRRVLKPDGVFLNHGITSSSGWERTPLTRFMNRYIFPDGELARVSEVIDAMEAAGFETLDVENLRRHYALTLRHWVSALERSRDAAVARSSEFTWRLWRLYMAGCAYYFDEGSIAVHQVLAGQRHQATAVPLRRDDLYRS